MSAESAFDRFARREPYFAVEPVSAYRAERITASDKSRFFADGDAIVQAVVRIVELRLAPHFGPTSILEFGCGVGRLALPLARLAARRNGMVHAVDCSPAMLDHARQHAADRGLDNMTFSSADELDASSVTFDFINCYGVLQRMSPADGLALIDRLLGRVLPGGIVAIQVPVWNRASRVTRGARWVRTTIPGTNALVNLARRQRMDDPFIPSHAYDVTAIMAAFERARFPAVHVVFEDRGDLHGVVAIGEAPTLARSSQASDALVSLPVTSEVASISDLPDAGTIDVRRMVATTSIEELNRRAEQYFSSLSDWDHHLAKPFATPAEAPSLLLDAAILMRALDLVPGMTVLEFGAGTGWLSRFLTQLGCSVTLLDVSPTALRMAQALYNRLPVIGDRPAPTFLEFDGMRIAVPDASIDRIVCFHAFHHAANPAHVIREFGRILRPGGLVGFAEPGPRHSATALSQFEMRHYGVVENDVDVHAIWRLAQAIGFTHLRMGVFNGFRFEVSLDEYEDFLRGGEVASRWTASARGYSRNVSNFVMVKAGDESRDSRSAEGLACVIDAGPVRIASRAEVPVPLKVRVTNTGSASWLVQVQERGAVSLGVRVHRISGEVVTADVVALPFGLDDRTVRPGELVEVAVSLEPLARGDYTIDLDCVADGVTWFAQTGSRPVRISLSVA